MIIAHGDCDGICAAAIIYSVYGGSVIFTRNPQSLSHILYWKEIEEDKGPIFIVDNPFLKNDERFIHRIKELAPRCYYFDHHESSLPLPIDPRSFKEMIIDVTKSASQIVSEYYGTKETLGKLGAIGDRYIILSRKYRLRREAELLRSALTYDPLDDKFRFMVMKELAYGRMPSEIPEVKKRAKDSIKMLKYILKEAKKRVVDCGPFVFIDMTDRQSIHGVTISGRVSIVTSKIAISHGKPAVVLFMNNGKRVLVGRAPDECDINLVRIFGKYWEAGGHKRAASARVDDNPDKIVEKLQRSMEGLKCYRRRKQ